jgi:hypothetical protein
MEKVSKDFDAYWRVNFAYRVAAKVKQVPLRSAFGYLSIDAIVFKDELIWFIFIPTAV